MMMCHSARCAMPTVTETQRFLVYRSKESKHFMCVCDARDRRHALKIARRMFALTRTAMAIPESSNPNAVD